MLHRWSSAVPHHRVRNLNALIYMVSRKQSFCLYEQMRSLVNHRSFLLRKALDGFLNRLLPQTWIPLYTMVSDSPSPRRLYSS